APSFYFRAVKNAFPNCGAPLKNSSRDLFEREPERAEDWAEEIAQAYHGAAGGENPASLGRALLGGHPLDLPLLKESENRGTARRIAATFAALKPPEEARIESDIALQFW